MIRESLILEAADFLKGKVRETPLEYSPVLSTKLGFPVYLKLENLQVTGSFKIRGAWFAMSRLTAEARQAGVITCSAGNHGKAVAFAARNLGIDAEVWVPRSIEQVKYDGIVAMGARCVRAETDSYDQAYAFSVEAAQKSGRTFVHAFESPEVMAGNGGSLAVEVLRQLPEARSFLLPVGGGGMMAGFASHIRRKVPEASLIGCQHRDSPALHLSLERGQAVTELPYVPTLAGGIEGGIGESTFAIIKETINTVALVTEGDIYAGVRWILDHHQYVMEPSCAPVIAACLKHETPVLQGPAVLVVSGRNLSTATLERILHHPTGEPVRLT